MRTAATFMRRAYYRSKVSPARLGRGPSSATSKGPRGRSVRPRGRRGRSEVEVLLVDRGPDGRQRLALALHAHHVTRDVQAHGSGRGVAREGDAPVRFGLHVAGSVRDMSDVRTAARTRHPAKRVGIAGREGVEPGRVALRCEARRLALRHRLVLVTDLVDGDRLGIGADPPG